jgi:hypothetical protein
LRLGVQKIAPHAALAKFEQAAHFVISAAWRTMRAAAHAAMPH